MRTVLVTGGTGAVGSALVPVLLAEPETRLRLLVRANSAEHLEQRVRELLAFAGLDRAAVANRLTAVRGDVTRPRLGLAEEEYAELVGEVTHVVHSAGNVRLNQPLEKARLDAVEAARGVLELCRACQARGGFGKLEHVSTVGVAGRTRGLVREEPFDSPPGFHNTYEQAKWEAEGLVLAAGRAGLPVTIHRPSMVVGDSRTGKIAHPQVFAYLAEFLSGTRTLGLLPQPGGVRLDIVPVDYVARALAVSVSRLEAAGRIFHLCLGPDEAPRVADLAVDVRRVFARQGRRLPALRWVPRGLFRAATAVGSCVAPGAARKALKTLPYFLAYLDEDQLFDNRAARASLEPVGVVTPPVGEYLERVLTYGLAAGTGRG